MSVPVAVARDRVELARALDRTSHADLVLLDTAGRADPEEIAKQAALIQGLPGIQIHLVLSAASGAQELAAIADRYRTLSPDRLIITKVDEAVGPGGILSAAVRVGRPIACVANGQRVPEDLHVLTGPELVDLVVGEGNGSRS
jgi:flagellar biosynthesis protein FlhF